MSKLTKSAVGRRSVLVAAGGLLAAPAIVRAQGRNGVALVIGNAKYQWEAQLPNVKRDVPDLTRTFEGMGLKTVLIQDAGKGAMEEAIANFAAAARGAPFAAFYFAGHGTQWNNKVFLVPVDADLSTPKTDGLVDALTANRACSGARANMRVYDNCRNNPADGWQQKQAEDQSLVRGTDQEGFVSRNPNSLALFSTAPGRVALDGPAGQNSPFASAVMRQLSGASVDIAALSGKVRRDVLMATRGRQVVVDQDAYSGTFSIKGSGGGTQAPGGGEALTPVELGKAYAFAGQSGILLPRGLVALRAAGSASQQQKVGSYKYTVTWPGQGSVTQILIVLAIDSDGTPEFIVSGPANKGWWRFVKGKVGSDRIEYRSHSGKSSPYTVFKWRDANSGAMTVTWPDAKPVPKPFESTFERLDG